MKSKEEILRALALLQAAFRGAVAARAKDHPHARCMAIQIDTLWFVLGVPSSMEDLIRECEEVAAAQDRATRQ